MDSAIGNFDSSGARLAGSQTPENSAPQRYSELVLAVPQRYSALTMEHSEDLERLLLLTLAMLDNGLDIDVIRWRILAIE